MSLKLFAVITSNDNPSLRIAVPDHLLSGEANDHYVLRVVGDSMTEDGIHDGDYIVVLRSDKAHPGNHVVALVGDDATIKRYYPDGEDYVILQSPSCRSRFKRSEVVIQGIAVGLMRKL